MNKTQKSNTQGGTPILRKSDLHDYQSKAVEHILDKPKSALFLDMGLTSVKLYQHSQLLKT